MLWRSGKKYSDSNDQLTGNWVITGVKARRESLDLHQDPSNREDSKRWEDFSDCVFRFGDERIFWNWPEDLYRPRNGEVARDVTFSHETIESGS